MPDRPTKLAAALAAALAVALAPAASGGSLDKASVAAPKSGARYTGATEEDRRLTRRISGKSIQIVAFDFECGRKTIASTSLQSLPLKRSDRGYRFKISTYGLVSYRDGEPDENAAIAIRGRFSRTARRVAGLLRVKTPRCHDSGYLEWVAKLR